MLTGSKMADSTTTSVVAVADLGAGAAHDPGDADRAARVGDEQRLGVEVADDVVERLEPLARPSRGGR